MRLGLATLLVFAPVAAAPQQAGPHARPAGALSADITAAIAGVFADLADTGPGCAGGVVVDGTLAFADGYGTANLDHGIPITPQTVFYMASVSKQFTAAAVALAARQGHLSLDDDVRTHIAELPDYGTPITIRHLIHHTSGIRDYLTLRAMAGAGPGGSDEEVIALLARQKGLNFTPGDRYLYSNSGYFLLSQIVKRATGLSLREYAEREFFGPLGMANTHFHDDAGHIVPHRATGYAPADGGFRMNHAWEFEQVGSGGLYSNIEDMARWDAAFEAGKVGPSGFRESLFERGVLNNGDTLDYAFGLSIARHRGVPVISHGGSLAGFRTHVARFPEQATTVMVFCNVTNADPGGRAEKVAHLLLRDRLGPADTIASDHDQPGDQRARPALSPADLAAFAGRYYSEELEATRVIRAGDGVLIVEGVAARLAPLDRDVFGAGSVRFRFQRDRAGRVTGYIVDAGRANGIIFERRPSPGG